jgi:hypothetical protein
VANDPAKDKIGSEVCALFAKKNKKSENIFTFEMMMMKKCRRLDTNLPLFVSYDVSILCFGQT